VGATSGQSLTSDLSSQGSTKSYGADSVIQAAADGQDNSRHRQNARKSHPAQWRLVDLLRRKVEARRKNKARQSGP
jgi:hypothetical protein